MSGPVWKRLRLEGTCDACGGVCDELFASGTVVDFKFTPDFRYCASCYARYAGRYDELNPKAVAEQQNPPALSRPIAKGDMPD